MLRSREMQHFGKQHTLRSNGLALNLLHQIFKYHFHVCPMLVHYHQPRFDRRKNVFSFHLHTHRR